MVEIIYGGGLRLSECLKLRIKDIDFQNYILTIRSGKGDKDRQTLLSQKTALNLKEHILKTRKIYEDDRFDNHPGVELPKALERKYPNAGKEWGWFWVMKKRTRSEVMEVYAKRWTSLMPIQKIMLSSLEGQPFFRSGRSWRCRGEGGGVEVAILDGTEEVIATTSRGVWGF